MTWYGQCPQCGAWNSLQAVPESRSGAYGPGQGQSSPIVVSSLDAALKTAYIPSGNQEIDEFFGGGLVKGGVYLLGGEPGIGKSTWLMQLSSFLARQGLKSVYISGEESLEQIQTRANRVLAREQGLFFAYSTRLEEIFSVLDQGYEFAVIDSVQTIAASDVESGPGSVSQVREVASRLINLAKEKGLILFLIGHVTKDGLLAGPKLLEHMVDSVLYFEGDREYLFRLLRIVKNRYGPANEILVLEMGARGLSIVADPCTFFLEDAGQNASGQALTLTLEGQKVLAVEVQALVNQSFLAMPRRVALGVDQNRLNLLLAVLEKRLNLNLRDKDVYVKIGSGLQIKEPAIDLALCAAILSSFYDLILPKGSVFWGEVDLNGQIRSVVGQELRLKQAKRLGYAPIFYPQPSLSSLTDISKILLT